MCDINIETMLPLSAASRHPTLRAGRRKGRPIHRATLERWRTRGCVAPNGSRVVLETVKVGGIRATTVEAINRFFARLDGAPADGPTPGSPTELRRQHEAAEQELEAAGV